MNFFWMQKNVSFSEYCQHSSLNEIRSPNATRIEGTMSTSCTSCGNLWPLELDNKDHKTIEGWSINWQISVADRLNSASLISFRFWAGQKWARKNEIYVAIAQKEFGLLVHKYFLVKIIPDHSWKTIPT